jgi:7-carboxy-7-deazaguanine synthase
MRSFADRNGGQELLLTVTEIFKSIQGESTWAGLPCIFVRLTGCNLRCAYCDTRYAYEGGTRMSIRKILERCEALGNKLVEITGGEPLMQDGCALLAEYLLERGYTVLVETNGTLPIRRLPAAVIKIMDIKSPSSGMSDQTDWTNIEVLSTRDEVKFVIGHRTDYEWSREVVRRYDLTPRCAAVLFSPVFGVLEPDALAAWILEDGLAVRLQLQLHNYIWSPDQRGL